MNEVFQLRRQVREELLSKLTNKSITEEILSIDVTMMDPFVLYYKYPDFHSNYDKDDYTHQFDKPTNSYVMVPKSASQFYFVIFQYLRSAGARKGIAKIIKQINSS